jgi:hypothetical protein
MTRPWAHPAVMPLLLACLLVAQLLIAVFRGAVWIDEGFYLYAAVRLADGISPYGGYFYHRLPLHPGLYSLSQVLGPSLIAGRLLSAVLCGSLAFIVWRTAGKLSGIWAANAALAMFVINPWAAYHYAAFAGYALEGLLLTLAFACFCVAREKPSQFLAAVGCTALLILERYPLDYVVCLFALLLIVAAVRLDRRGRLSIAGILAVFIAVVLLLPTVTGAPLRDIFYQTFTFNRNQNAEAVAFGTISASRSLFDGFAERLQTESRLARIMFAPLLLLIAGLCASPWPASVVSERGARIRWAVLGALVVIVTNEVFYLLFAGASPVQRLYVYPLLTIIAATVMAELRTRNPQSALPALATALVAAAVILVPLIEETAPIRMRGQSEVAVLESIASATRAALPKGERLLTFNPAIAGAAGVPGFDGLEMGFYAFAPTWSTARATATRRMNVVILDSIIRHALPGAILLDESLFYNERHTGAMLNPYRASIRKLIEDNYVLARVVTPERHQYPGRTEVWVRRGPRRAN